MAEYILIDEMVKRARDLYDSSPHPETMNMVLGSMYETLQKVAEIRGDLGDLSDKSFWDALIAGHEEAEKMAADRAAAMQDWDDRAAQFWLRFEEYNAITAVAMGGETTAGQYLANVVQPVLHGNAYASPGREAWSHTRFADVTTPFRLWNELTQYLEGTELLARLEGWTRQVIQTFAQSVKDKALEAAGDLGEAATAPLVEKAEEIIADAQEDLIEEKEKAVGQVQASLFVAAAVVTGLAVGAAWLFSRRRRRRR